MLLNLMDSVLICGLELINHPCPVDELGRFSMTALCLHSQYVYVKHVEWISNLCFPASACLGDNQDEGYRALRADPVLLLKCPYFPRTPASLPPCLWQVSTFSEFSCSCTLLSVEEFSRSAFSQSPGAPLICSRSSATKAHVSLPLCPRFNPGV